MRFSWKVQFYTYVHLYIISLCPHIHIIYINIYKYINAQVPPTHSLPNCMSYHVYKLYRKLISAELKIVLVISSKTKVMGFLARIPPSNNKVPGLARGKMQWEELGRKRGGENHFRGPIFLDT